MKFSKTLITAATLLALTSAAQAQTKEDKLIEIYGRANISVDQLDDGDKYSRLNLSSNASRLGFRGSKSFGNLKGIWQIEQEIQVNLDQKQSNDDNRLATRDTFVGLQGDFGTVRAGKFDTPFKVARGPFNLFGDELGDMRNLTKVGKAAFDERWNNMLEYQTPVMNGFQAKIAHSFATGSAYASNTSGVEQKQDATSVSLGYKAGNLDATLAYETYGANTTGTGKRDATRAAIAYKINSDLSVMGFYQTADSKDTTVTPAKNESADVTGIGLQYMVSPKVALKAQYMDRKADAANSDASMYTVGGDYRYDKGLSFYVSYAGLKNESASTQAPWAQGRTTSKLAGVGDKTATGLSVGVRLDF
jgi:predicted porin